MGENVNSHLVLALSKPVNAFFALPETTPYYYMDQQQRSHTQITTLDT